VLIDYDSIARGRDIERTREMVLVEVVYVGSVDGFALRLLKAGGETEVDALPTRFDRAGIKKHLFRVDIDGLVGYWCRSVFAEPLEDALVCCPVKISLVIHRRSPPLREGRHRSSLAMAPTARMPRLASPSCPS